MARIRTVKPEFWTSEQVADCSPTARLLFIGMWNFCDDYGVHPASAKRLKMEIFPADSFSLEQIEGWIDELREAGLLTEYTADGAEYWAVTGWKHQKIEKPQSKFPKPPCKKVADHSPSGSRSVADQTPPEGNGRESNGEESKGYKFDGRVIRLVEKDYDLWRKAYHAIPDFNAELTRCDAKVEPGSNWFPTVSAMLNAKHQKLLAEQKARNPKADTRTDDERYRDRVSFAKRAFAKQRPPNLCPTPDEAAKMLGRGDITQEEAAYFGVHGDNVSRDTTRAA